jgi:hypothetical protein
LYRNKDSKIGRIKELGNVRNDADKREDKNLTSWGNPKYTITTTEKWAGKTKQEKDWIKTRNRT